MAINTSPDVENLQVGKGIVSFKPAGETVFIDLGNVPELEYEPSIEKLDHFSSRAGIRTKDKSVVIERGGSLRLLMEEITARNLSMLLMGTIGTGPAATGTFSIPTGNALNTETVVIDGKTYTFQTTLTNVNGNVLIGANAAASLANLKAAINLEAGAGTLYATAMTLHPTVTASHTAASLSMGVTAKVPGAGGNSIVTTDTVTAGSWAAGTLTGGDSNPTIDIFTSDTISGELKFTATNDVGPKWDLHFYNVEFSPSGAFNPISDEWNQIEVTGEVLVAAAGHPNVGKVGMATLTNGP